MAKESQDFLSELANDSGYQRMIGEREQRRKKQRAILDEDQKKLVSELNAAGVQVNSVWDLVNTTGCYAGAIPILVEHLEREHHPRTQEGIVRALSTPESRGFAFEPLVQLFQEITDGDSEIKWLVGAAIAESATAADAIVVAELMEEESHGRGREFLPLALIHSPRNAAVAILKPLLEDPVMGKSVAKAISLLD